MYKQIFQEVDARHPEYYDSKNIEELETNINAYFKDVDKIKIRRIYSNHSYKNLSFIKKLKKLVQCIKEWMDFKIWTDKIEHIDRPNYPVKKKQQIIRLVYQMGMIIGTPPIVFKILKELAEEICKGNKKKLKALGLASGSGELEKYLARKSIKEEVPIEVSGSDYIEAYMKKANEDAKREGLPIDFIHVDALSFESILKGIIDLVYMCHALHHFKAGEVGRIILNAVLKTNYGFLGVCGYRTALNIPLMTLGTVYHGLLFLAPYGYHYGGWLTVRKLWAEAQYEQIVKMIFKSKMLEGSNYKLEFLKKNPLMTLLRVQKID